MGDLGGEYRPAPTRPGVVTAAGVLLLVGGALGALGGLLILTGAGAAGAAGGAGAGAMFVIVALVMLGLAALQIWAGVQVLALKERGRRVAVILAGISAVLALLQLGRSPTWSLITIAIDAFIIWALVTNQELFTT